MSAAEILKEIERQHISIALVDGSLKCKAANPIPTDLIKRLKENKAKIVRLLDKQQPPVPVEIALKACPLCNGRDFIHGKKGGYFCVTCQPGIEGTPVKAGNTITNKNRPP